LVAKCESPAFPQGFAGLLPSHCGSKNFSTRVVIDLATERQERKRAKSVNLHPPHIVQLLAQAEEFQRLLDSGEAASRADPARRLTMSRGRVTQILDLLLLEPQLLSLLRHPPAGTPSAQISERNLRRIVRDLSGQRRLARRLVQTKARSA
jgi:hypothetical protein